MGQVRVNLLHHRHWCFPPAVKEPWGAPLKGAIYRRHMERQVLLPLIQLLSKWRENIVSLSFTITHQEISWGHNKHSLVQKYLFGGTWVAQCPTCDFSSGHDLTVLRSSPVMGSLLKWESACPSPSVPPCHLCSLLFTFSPSQNK